MDNKIAYKGFDALKLFWRSLTNVEMLTGQMGVLSLVRLYDLGDMG
jgi:hypothetical protein